MIVKSIETTWAGYKTRSRLEARYLVAFDSLGLKYLYEVEGFSFQLTRGYINYLPDIYLPTLDSWVEIKPGEPTALEKRKAMLLCIGTQRTVYLFVGDPWDTTRAYQWLYAPETHEALGVDSACFYFCECTCGCINLKRDNLKHLCDCGHSFSVHRGNTPKLIGAYVAARQERFEGQKRRKRKQ